jgi:hypothetical protein
MEKSKVDMYLGLNIENFPPEAIPVIKEKLEKMDDDKFYLLQGIGLEKPSTIFLIAILLGLERFWLNDTTMAILKLVTGNGCGIWWLIDIFSAKERAKQYNLKKFMEATSILP